MPKLAPQLWEPQGFWKAALFQALMYVNCSPAQSSIKETAKPSCFATALRANEHVTARAELAGDSIETREPCEVHCWMLGLPRALQSGREPEPVNCNASCSYKLQHARDRLIRQDSAVVTKLSARTAHLGHCPCQELRTDIATTAFEKCRKSSSNSFVMGAFALPVQVPSCCEVYSVVH